MDNIHKIWEKVERQSLSQKSSPYVTYQNKVKEVTELHNECLIRQNTMINSYKKEQKALCNK